MLDLRQKAWSPYLAGAIIGLLQIPAFLLIDTALGASSSYVTMATGLAAVFDGRVLTEEFPYLARYVDGAKDWWQLALVIGVALGAWLSARSSGLLRRGVSPIWGRAVGLRSVWARGAMGFAAGYLMLLGARLAGGCTSGHGLSGTGQLAISSLIVVACMFAGGIAAAMMMRKL
jgi:hypothetical protein